MHRMALPPARSDQIFVKVSALDGGRITLPDHCFVHPSNKEDKRTVPSLSFLIQHPKSSLFGRDGHQRSRQLMFDLGLRSNIEHYLPTQQSHLRKNRVPYRLGPSIADQLAKGTIDPDDIDAVILSHVHYDHHGDPEDFKHGKFIVGPGSLSVLQHGLPGSKGSHQAFDSKLLPLDRTIELEDPQKHGEDTALFSAWSPVGPFPSALDVFGDGSVYIIDSPGHLPGHINLLCRVSPKKWIYLAGDSGHDMRLLTGEKNIGTWEDEHGDTYCIHLDREGAEQTIKRIQNMICINRGSGQEIEIILAHDDGWLNRNQHRMFPETL